MYIFTTIWVNFVIVVVWWFDGFLVVSGIVINIISTNVFYTGTAVFTLNMVTDQTIFVYVMVLNFDHVIFNDSIGTCWSSPCDIDFGIVYEFNINIFWSVWFAFWSLVIFNFRSCILNVFTFVSFVPND